MLIPPSGERNLYKMKRKLTRLSRRYASALRKHLKEGPKASLQPAQGLGQQAGCLGMGTLVVANIREGAPANLEASSSRVGIIEQAEVFFSEAVSPIEKTQHGALKTKTP